MSTILLTIHLLIALALVGVILLQRSEGGALGIGGGGMGGLMSGRSSANLLDPHHRVPGSGVRHNQLAPGDHRQPRHRAALNPRPARRPGSRTGGADHAACPRRRLRGDPE